jgi:hypothetical protein
MNIYNNPYAVAIISWTIKTFVLEHAKILFQI